MGRHCGQILSSFPWNFKVMRGLSCSDVLQFRQTDWVTIGSKIEFNGEVYHDKNAPKLLLVPRRFCEMSLRAPVGARQSSVKRRWLIEEI